MYTQTLYELSQEAERLLQLSRQQLQLLEKIPLSVPGDGNDSNLLIVFYVQIMPDDLVMQLHRF